MRKTFTIIGGIIAFVSAASLNAAPLAQKPLSKLLGLRASGATAFTGAPAVSTPAAPRAKAPLKAAANGETTVYASVVYPDNVVGMWSYPVNTYNPTSLASGIMASGGGLAANGSYYANRYLEMMGFEEIRTLEYKMSDWSEYDSYTGKIEYVATTMAYSPRRDEAYGCFINAERNGYNFVEWNYSYFGIKRTICPIERPWSGCAFSSDGTLYAIERNGDLYTVNLLNGEMTLVGSTGVESTYLGDATIDTATDKMYWSVTTDTDFGLYEVDIKTATANKIYDLLNEEQLCGMFVPEPEKVISPEAPAKVSSMSTSFSGSSMSGKIYFYTPRATAGGTAFEAGTPLTYTLRANGDVIATGDCEAGYKRTEIPVTLDTPDNYYFTITTSNEAGESDSYGTRKFVGPDTPKASTVTASVSGNTVTLSWSSPSSTGVNGGNVDYSNATYRIVRYPDNVVLAEAFTGTPRSLTDELPETEVRVDYTYGVTSTVTGLKSPEAKSPVISMGPITPPFEGTFPAATALAGWTILDANGDGTLWKYSSSYKLLEVYGSKGFDDWAITPAVKVRAGTSYPFTATLKTSNYYNETFEVMWGTEPTPEAMTNTLIEATEFKSYSALEFMGEISAKESGKIYIGFHAKSAAPSNTIDLVSFTIGDGITAAAPAAPANLKAESPVDGTRQATLTFNVPDKTLGGDPLTDETKVTSVTIARDGKLIATLTENIASGAECVYTDKADDLTLGTHLYTVIAINDKGEGPAAEAEVLVGARKPVAPESAVMIEEGNTGKVTISWTPVTTDVEGNTFGADAVTYRVIDREYNVIADNITDTSITVTAVEEGEQAFCQFGVYAVTAGGESDKMAATAYKPVGTPYSTPWSESFKNRTVSSIFGYNYIKGNSPWQFVSTQTDWGIQPQDGDGGFAYFECYGDLTALVTGKMDLAGLNNPAFSFYTYNFISSISEPSNQLELQVDNGDGEGFRPVEAVRVCETGEANQWNKVIIPLSDYEGQSVIFRIEPKTPQLAFYTLDNLRVSSYVDFNLSAAAITAPTVADVDKPFEVNVTVSNTGESTINNYTVELWINDEPVDFAEGSRIEPNTTKVLTFEETVTVLHGEYAEIKAVIVCDNDHVEVDNTTETVSVGIISPAVPSVGDLSATSGAEGAVLTWSHPDESVAPGEPFTETFDTAESWTSNIDGWKMLDEDKIPVGGTNTPGFPCTNLQSWFVVNNQLQGIQEGTDPTRWNAHSGTQYIASEYVMRSNTAYQSDDWAITPRLHSHPHALSFFAKSFDPAYLESFEVLASSATTNIDDFTTIGSVVDVPNAWTQYRFKLPEGSKYAAIRSRSTDKYFLFIDDVTFIPADAAPAVLERAGYHVYRNGVRITDTPVTEPTFTDTNAQAGRDHSYFVTAVYDKGESRPSNTVSVTVSGLIDAASAAAGVSIRTIGSTLVVTGLTDGEVSVFAADGRTVAIAEAAQTVRIQLHTGVYIVKAGNKTAKVVVK